MTQDFWEFTALDPVFSVNSVLQVPMTYITRKLSRFRSKNDFLCISYLRINKEILYKKGNFNKNETTQ